jgi:hypothetical protein
MSSSSNHSLCSSPFISFHLLRPPTLIFIWTSSSFFSSFEPGSDRIGSVSRSLLVSISGACSPSRFLCVHAFHPHVYSASLVHRSFLYVFFLILLASINSDRRGKPKANTVVGRMDETPIPYRRVEEGTNGKLSRGCLTFRGHM